MNKRWMRIIFAILVASAALYILYEQIGGWATLAVYILLYANNLTHPVPEKQEP